MNPLKLPKDFWPTVKAEIETSKLTAYLLCSRSMTFAAAWDNKELAQRISALANLYLTFRPANYYVGCYYLFVRQSGFNITNTEAKQFRNDFVNWCVENNY